MLATVPVSLLRQASQIFLGLAYAGGTDNVPPMVLPFCDLHDDFDLTALLSAAPQAKAIIRIAEGVRPSISIRLGSDAFSFLRMTLQPIEYDGAATWLFAVDTHDSWHHPDHPDAIGWLTLQAANRELKARIEKAWDDAGILTHNRLLRQELAAK